MRNLKFDLTDVAQLDNGIWTIGKIFDTIDFEYIKDSVIASPQDLYSPSPANPETRFELTWQRNGVLDELWTAFESFTPAISQLTDADLRFGQIRVWQDHPGFMIPFHEDDQSAFAHIQVYIDGPSEDIGTTWYTTKGRHSCPFIPNTGYLTICSERLPHGMLRPVGDRIRYSLYATFNKKS